MKRAFLLTAIFICNFLILSGQTIKITGHIPEEKGGKKVSGAALYLKPDGKQTFSDDLGNFSFTSARGNKQITARLLGFKSVTIKFNLTSDTVINIPMTISPARKWHFCSMSQQRIENCIFSLDLILLSSWIF